MPRKLKPTITPLEQSWVDWMYEACSTKGDGYVQIRKFFFNKSWTIPWEIFNTGISSGFDTLGYSDDGSKLEQLKRNYYNQAEVERIRDTFIQRLKAGGGKSKQTCVTARFGNAEKDSRSQGYCMQTMTINWFASTPEGKPSFVIELYYRSTEMCKKFFADLKFLDEVVFPELLKGVPVQPTQVRFVFCASFISTVFIPILLKHGDPQEFLTRVKAGDPKFFKLMLRDFHLWLFAEENPYNYRSRKRMVDYGKEEVIGKLSASEVQTLKKFVAAHYQPRSR